MSKKKVADAEKLIEYEKLLEKSKINKIKLEEEMKSSFISYAMAVNLSRAIPDIRDGLKPVHRRIIYAMSELGLTSDKPYRKSARVVGDVLGKYHTHGEASIYDALVKMAQDFSMREPIIDGHGNFGSVDGDSPAAARYTEARLSKIASELIRDLDKETVDFYPNFDDTMMQPTVLPARYPNLLVNGTDGIAVGMATNIPPHNLNEVIDGVVAMIDNPDITLDDLMHYIPAPDYPTAGLIMNRNAIKHAYKTGRGGITIRARAEIEEYANGTRSRIVVTELPYQVNKSRLIERIAELVKDKRIEGITDANDYSDRTGMRIVIDIKRDAQAYVVLNTLYKMTDLQVKNGITFLSIVNGEPKILGLKDMLMHYLDHQVEVVERRTRYDLEKAKERAHIVEGLVKALAHINEVIRIIRKSRDTHEAQEQLQKAFLLTEKQTKAIIEMRLGRLAQLEVEKLKNELKDLQEKIKHLEGILKDKKKQLAIVRAEILEVKGRHGNERRSELSYDSSEIESIDLVEKEDVMISMTHLGYIKRLPTSEIRTQRRGGKGAKGHKPKEEDFVVKMFTACTHDDVLFFTNKGRVYCIKAFMIPEASKSARGRALVNLLNLEEDERVAAVIPLEERNVGNLIMATRSGLIKKTSLKEFERINRTGKIAIKLNEGDQLIAVEKSNGRDEIIVASFEGKCIRFSEEHVRAMGRNTAGVRSMKLGDDDYVVDMCVVKDGHQIITITENGYGKRSELEEYRLQSRSGKGVKAGKFTEKTGRLIGLKQVREDDDLMVIADNGVVIRMNAKEISKISRDTQGVRLMRIKNEGKVVTVAVTPPEAELIEEEEEE